MKKRIWSVITVVTLTMLTVGCAKSREKEISDQFQAQGFSQEAADAMAEEAVEWEDQKAAEDSAEKAAAESIDLVAPKNEIVNSKLSDKFIQLEDTIIPMDGSITVKELLDVVQGCYDFTVNTGDTTSDSVTSDTWTVIFYDEEGNEIIYANARPSSMDSLSNVYDCIVYEIAPCSDSVYALNFFYPGNICASTYVISEYSPIRETDRYKERLEQYPPIRVDEIEDYLSGQDCDFGYDDYDDDCWAECNEVNEITLGDQKLYITTRVEFEIDKNSGTFKDVHYDYNMHTGDETYKYFTDPKELPAEVFETVSAACVENILEDYSNSGSSAELVGYLIRADYTSVNLNNPQMVLVYITDDGVWYTAEPEVSRTYNGEWSYLNTYGIVSVGNYADCYNPSSSAEEFLENSAGYNLSDGTVTYYEY